MKKYIISLLAILLVGFLAYQYSLFSFLLIGIIILCLCSLTVTGIIKIFNRDIKQNWFFVPAAIVLVSMIAIVIGWFRPLDSPLIMTDDISSNLAHAFKTDQSDRMNIRFYTGIDRRNMQQRDSIRLHYVKKLSEENKILSPWDQFHAAFILHHGNKSKLYEMAHKLAKQAAAAKELKNTYQVQWLVKATFDRWMLSLGKPQKFGTQGKIGISIH